MLDSSLFIIHIDNAMYACIFSRSCSYRSYIIYCFCHIRWINSIEMAQSRVDPYSMCSMGRINWIFWLDLSTYLPWKLFSWTWQYKLLCKQFYPALFIADYLSAGINNRCSNPVWLHRHRDKSNYLLCRLALSTRLIPMTVRLRW